MITKAVNLWLGSGPRVVIPVSQFDTAWEFVFTIINAGTEWTIPAGANVVMNGLKPDGNVFSFAGTVSNNTVTVDCDVQMTACAGETECELSILADGVTVGTCNFILLVEAAPKSPGDVSSGSTLPAYAEMLEMFSGDISTKVDAWLNAHSGEIGGLSDGAKRALLTLLTHIAYTDDQGQAYYDALEDELYPPAELYSITATFFQGGATIYDTDSLDTLKQYLTVTATYTDATTETVTTYTLSGTLTVGTSTITVTYEGKTDTFTVVVTEKQALSGYTEVGTPTIVDGILTPSAGNFVKTNFLFSPENKPWKIRAKYKPTTFGINCDVFGGVDASDNSARTVLYEIAYGPKFGLYLSSNNSSWDISTGTANMTHPAAGEWTWVEIEYTGTSYIGRYSADGTLWTDAKTVTSSSKIYGGCAVGFGLKRNAVFNGEIDLHECKIYIDGELYWKAIA